jgi:hypothetical protein
MTSRFNALMVGAFLGIAILFTGLHVVATATPAQASSASVDPVFPRGLPYAPTDGECYSYRCVWDARHQGNGEGHSVILTRHDGDYLAQQISHRRAHRLQAAWCQRPNVTCDGYED